jgi:hypothetical protein
MRVRPACSVLCGTAAARASCRTSRSGKYGRDSRGSSRRWWSHAMRCAMPRLLPIACSVSHGTLRVEGRRRNVRQRVNACDG